MTTEDLRQSEARLFRELILLAAVGPSEKVERLKAELLKVRAQLDAAQVGR